MNNPQDIRSYAGRFVEVDWIVTSVGAENTYGWLVGEGTFTTGSSTHVIFIVVDEIAIRFLFGIDITNIKDADITEKLDHPTYSDSSNLVISYLSTYTTSNIENVRLYPQASIQPPQDLSHYPHTCPRCGFPAYIGGDYSVDCIKGCK